MVITKNGQGSKLFLFVFFLSWGFICPGNIASQPDIPFERQLSGEDILTSYKNELVLLEFWATWCGPCIAAFNHTEYLQEVFSSDLKVVAMTDESYMTVLKFMEKHPLKSIILTDADDFNHDRYSVTQIPYAVLLDPSGIVLWIGHPSNLHEEELSTFVKQKKTTSGVSALTFVQKNSSTENKEKIPLQKVTVRYKKRNKVIEFRELPQGLPFEIETEGGVILVRGNIEELIKYLLDKPNSAFQSSLQINPTFEIKFTEEKKRKREILLKHAILQYFLDRYKMELDSKMDTLTGYMLTVTEVNRLWDKDRLQLTDDGESIYLIDEENIEADNYTPDAFSKLLSEKLKKPVKFSNAIEGIYDWKLHIKYFELMEEQLREEYGIKLNTYQATGEVIHVRQK